jgi:hypothetical protein
VPPRINTRSDTIEAFEHGNRGADHAVPADNDVHVYRFQQSPTFSPPNTLEQRYDSSFHAEGGGQYAVR